MPTRMGNLANWGRIRHHRGYSFGNVPMNKVFQVGLAVSLSVALLACSQDESATPATPEVAGTSVTPTEQTRIGANLRAMTVDQLRAELTKANADTRLYAPAGSNAFEILLALRDKLPGDVGVSSQLIDASPMLIAAIEQASTQADGVEWERLMGLLREADASNPAIAKLEAERKNHLAAMARERAAAAAEQQRIAAQQKAAQEAARIKVQSQTQSAQSAQRPAGNDRSSRTGTATKQPTVRELEEEDRGTANPSAADLRPLSTPDPTYPREALRNGTSGEVTVELTVGRDGSVIAARVISSRPRGTFDSSALDAVRSWRYGAISAPMTIRKTFAFKPDV